MKKSDCPSGARALTFDFTTSKGNEETASKINPDMTRIDMSSKMLVLINLLLDEDMIDTVQ